MHPAVSCDRRTMNSVSPSSAQYRGMAPDEVLPGEYSKKHLIGQSPSPKDVKSHFAHLTETGRSSEPDEVDKIKAKLMSAWNNVKYGWTVKTKTSFNKTSPLTLLGRTYILDNEDVVDQFRKNFISLIWLTYRREFQQLEGSVWTTDCGWGCMLRSGQMLLAQGLLAHLLPSGKYAT
ncbi:cysteine protease ATG4D-like [Polypterus senegalus]|uniref:cysteine protease ATG4D-like n=1 Tax=Polypterus senegalus TaxID=55291 RepID=UPI001963F745|nr:cysteine protease ATG4D-like [Polypterus senegalus]